MLNIIAYAIYSFARLFVMLICLEAVMSWFTGSFGNGSVGNCLWKIYNIIRTVTEPVNRPFRKLLWRFSSGIGIDFSPILSILAVELVSRVIVNILYLIF